MEENEAIQALAALAQAQRLRIFRALVLAGPDGLTPGALSDALALAPSALSFHLKELARSGLASSEARGRNLIYRAQFACMNALLAYLTENCCDGAGCDLTPADSCCEVPR